MSTRRSLEDVLLRRTITPVAKPRHIFSPNEASSQQQLNHLRYLSAVMPVRKLTTVLSTTRTKIETLLLTKELIFFDRPPLIGAEHTPYYASDSIRMFLSKKVSEVQKASQRIVDLCHVPYVLPDGYSGVHVAVLQQRAWKSFMTHSDMLHHSRHDSLRGLTFIFRVLSFVLPSSGSGVSLEDRRPIIHRFQVTRDGPSNNRGGGFVEITRTTRATIHLPGPMVQNSSIIPTDSYDNASRGRNVDVEVLTLKISAVVTNRDSSVQQQGICLPPIAWLLRRADGGEYGPIVHCPRPMVQLIGLHVPNVWEIQRDSESVQTQTPKSRIMVSSVDDDVMRFVNEWKR